MIYSLDQMNNIKEYVGSAYCGTTKINVYKQGDFLHVYEANGIKIARHSADNFTVMESMYLAIAGCAYAENAGDIREDIFDRLVDIHLTKVDIPENSQWEYKLEGEYHDL